ncbi:type I DNA topoisomerase [Paraphotobacterium marinum]|uniref:type I DNA topoisomerase n=1 Tax=Paraphotobacterium marinum TaxID=1755811 RepID=UPI0039E8DF43
MSKSLVIVESPAKAKTINKYLGKNYIVKSSVGHIRDLPKGSSSDRKKAVKKKEGLTKAEKEKQKKIDEKNALIRKMGINPFDHWKAHYQILPGKEKVVAELKKLSENVDCIYLASDLDREGEAIAWHLKEVIGGDNSRFKRVVFNEITKNAIKTAFDHPTEINMDRVHAQQARRFLDRVVGFMVSPLLWKKVARGLSAGRVQSVAVKLLVEREKLIKAFVPEEYWDIDVETSTVSNKLLNLKLTHVNDKPYRIPNQKDAESIEQKIRQNTVKVVECTLKPTTSKPPAPFITSTLQQAASTKLGFGVKRTMSLAQRLYEAGYITYMRTDSTNLSKEAISSVRQLIEEDFGSKYLPKKANSYGNKDNSQEAHEAIRPSDVLVKKEQLLNIEPAALKLYELIWAQFVACQMTPAEYDSSTIVAKVTEFSLKAKGKTLRFPGWTVVMKSFTRNEDILLPDVTVNESLSLNKVIKKQHFTKPPARFTEAALVKELEKKGIGRPSTYASIISTIQERGYVKVDQRRFHAEKMGEIVTDRLDYSFHDLMSYDFTAKMEGDLDIIAEGNVNWTEVLDSFFSKFTTELNKAELPDIDGGMKPNDMVITNISCPTCSRPMGIRNASTGVFLGCSGYNLPPKERCKTTLNLMNEEGVVNILSDDVETDELRSKKRCSICGTAMDPYLIDEKRKLHICGNNPACSGYEVEKGEFKLKGYDGPVVECEKCGSDMQLKDGRFGKYMLCTNEECKNTRKILKNGEVAPPREDPIHFPELKCTKSDAYFVLRDGASGLFLAASSFPKSRETRAPLVSELLKYKDRLPNKFLYLTEAPLEDPEGNQSVVRYSRKNKESYVRTEVDGKPTNWSALYREGKWEIQDKGKKK